MVGNTGKGILSASYRDMFDSALVELLREQAPMDRLPRLRMLFTFHVRA